MIVFLNKVFSNSTLDCRIHSTLYDTTLIPLIPLPHGEIRKIPKPVPLIPLLSSSPHLLSPEGEDGTQGRVSDWYTGESTQWKVTQKQAMHEGPDFYTSLARVRVLLPLYITRYLHHKKSRYRAGTC